MIGRQCACGWILCAMMACSFAVTASAQLELPPLASPRPIDVHARSAAERFGSDLRDEAERRSDAGLPADVTAAQRAWRLLAAALLEQGMASGEAGDAAVMLARRWAAERRRFDEWSASANVDRLELRAFADAAERAMNRIPESAPESLLDIVYRAAAPLAARLASERRDWLALWPLHDAAAPLHERADEARRVRRALGALEVLTSSGGLGTRQPLRLTYDERRAEADRWLASGPDAEAMARFAEDLDRSVEALAALGRVREERAQRLLRETLLNLEAEAPLPWKSPDDEAARHWQRRMEHFISAAKGLPERPDIGPPPRMFAPMVRPLERAGRLAERATLDALERLSREPEAWLDPGIVVGLRAMTDHRADLERLHEMARWPELLGAMDAEAGRTVVNWLRQWAEHLSEPMRRDAARSRILRLQRELAAQERLAILLRENPDALQVQLAGGRPADVAVAVREAQRLWAQAWGRGAPDDAAWRRLSGLIALCESFDEGRMLADHSAPGAVLMLWPGWEMAPNTMERLQADFSVRIRLASTAAARREWGILEREVAHIERELPVVRLMARLADALAPELKDLESDSQWMLLRAVVPPPRSARFGSDLGDLASICRFVHESETARIARRHEDAERAWRYAADRARAVLERLE